MLDSILDFLSDYVLWIVVVVIVAVLGLICWAAIASEREWDMYAADHHCKKVGKKDGGISVGLGSNGKPVTVINPDQDIYRCDNDELVIR